MEKNGEQNGKKRGKIVAEEAKRLEMARTTPLHRKFRRAVWSVVWQQSPAKKPRASADSETDVFAVFDAKVADVFISFIENNGGRVKRDVSRHASFLTAPLRSGVADQRCGVVLAAHHGASEGDGDQADVQRARGKVRHLSTYVPNSV